MKGILKDAQAAMRERYDAPEPIESSQVPVPEAQGVSLGLAGKRYQVRRDGEKYVVVDTETLLCFGTSSHEAGAIKKAKRLNYEMLMRQIFPDEYPIPKPTPVPKLPTPRYAPRKQKVAKQPSEPHGRCWSKFGVVNADTQSLMQSSIPRWGFKIKTRSPKLPAE